MKNGLKETGRVVLAAVVSSLLMEGVLNLLLAGVKVDPTLKLALIAGLTAVLKGIDRQLHESGVAKKGLSRF